MANNGPSLPPRKQRAVIALLEHPTIVEAAEAAGIGYRTLTRWLSEDESFNAAIRTAQRQALNQTINQLASASPTAADVLFQIAIDESAPSSVRVQAASKIINELRQSMELVTISEDISQLKEIIHELETGN